MAGSESQYGFIFSHAFWVCRNFPESVEDEGKEKIKLFLVRKSNSVLVYVHMM